MVDPTPVTSAVVEAAPAVTPTLVSAQTVTTAPIEAVQAVVAPEATPVAPTVETAPTGSEKPPETILGEALKPVEPVLAPVPETSTEVKPTEGGQSDEPAPPPKYEPFALPEGTTFDEARMGEFTKLLSGLELDGKASHDVVQKFGQEAVNFHINEVQKAVQETTKFYQTSWDKQKTDWKTATLNDPELGGNRIQTTVDSALNFIRTHGGNAEQQKEFRDLMETSGLGNHPVILRVLSNAGRAMSEGAPLAATRPASAPKSKVATMYGKQ